MKTVTRVRLEIPFHEFYSILKDRLGDKVPKGSLAKADIPNISAEIIEIHFDHIEDIEK